MRIIKIGLLEALQKDIQRRFQVAATIPRLIKECRKSLMNLYEYVARLRVIEAASVIWSIEKWISVKGTLNRTNYKKRDIIEVDLGLGYGYEMLIVTHV